MTWVAFGVSLSFLPRPHHESVHRPFDLVLLGIFLLAFALCRFFVIAGIVVPHSLAVCNQRAVPRTRLQRHTHTCSSANRTFVQMDLLTDCERLELYLRNRTRQAVYLPLALGISQLSQRQKAQ